MEMDYPLLDLDEIVKRLDSLEGWELSIEGNSIEKRFFDVNSLEDAATTTLDLINQIKEEFPTDSLEFCINSKSIGVKVKNNKKQGLTLLEFKIAEKIEKIMESKESI